MLELVWATILAGIGGLLRGYSVEGGVVLPRVVQDERGRRIWEPGAAGGVVVGFIAGAVLWLLNTPPLGLDDPSIRPGFLLTALIIGFSGGAAFLGRLENLALRVGLSNASRALERTASTAEEDVVDSAAQNEGRDANGGGRQSGDPP